MNDVLKNYTYKHHIWLYKKANLWKRFIAELKIFLIIFAWIGLLTLYAFHQYK